MKRLLICCAGLAALALPALGQSSQGEEFVVPLSSPGEPVLLRSSLTYGSITVEGHDQAQVVVSPRVETRGLDGEGGRRANGLRRLPNRSMGLVVEEDDNVVKVSANGREEIDLLIRVPKRASLKVSTVNDGDIVVRGVQGELELGNTNGSITALDVSGSVVAHTTNGDVIVKLLSATAGKPMSFVSFNGDVDVTLPPGLAAELHMRSDQGEIFTDLDVEILPTEPKVEEDRKSGRYRMTLETEVRGRINGGGATVDFRTYNGDIFIRKGAR